MSDKPSDPAAERERRLAEALKANLRRRKTQARGQAARQADGANAPQTPPDAD